MKNTLVCVIMLILASGLSSCDKVKGKGEVVSQLRTVTGYTGLDLSISATIYFTTDSVYYMEVRAQQNILDVLETTVGSNNTLEINFKKGVIIGKHEPIILFIAAPDVRGFDVSGSGELFVNNPLISDFVDMNISGSGNISVFQMNANELIATISGSGNIDVNTGVVNQEQLQISGSGNIDLVGIESDTTSVNISGSGNASVWATSLLDVTITGSGNVYYTGNPIIQTHISGSGSVIRL
jgi:predicted small secreted protein